jgi:hypothetical protein
MEIWKDIPGYENYYQVSDLGRVKRLYRNDIIHNYGGFKVVSEKILNLYVDKRKYAGVRVTLSKNNIVKRFILSRLVAISFIPNPNNLPIVEHIDDDPTNNNVNNLKWGDYKSNTEAREKVLRLKNVYKITPEQKEFIKKSNLSGPELAKMFAVTKGYINNIKKGIR